jgi:hypothetical protein
MQMCKCLLLDATISANDTNSNKSESEIENREGTWTWGIPLSFWAGDCNSRQPKVANAPGELNSSHQS